jgi:hypothetical protein
MIMMNRILINKKKPTMKETEHSLLEYPVSSDHMNHLKPVKELYSRNSKTENYQQD